MLAAFAASWALLAFLTGRWTDQPQRWAKVPAAVMAVTAATILVLAPTGNQLGWAWPRARRGLPLRQRDAQELAVLEGTVTDENAATPVKASFNALVSEMTK